MLQISDLLKNISSGQSGIPTRLIFNRLDMVYSRLRPGIKILKVEPVKLGSLVYMLIPSQTDANKYYDVDFLFLTKNRITKTTKFKVYSNSPNFGFSYTYLFHKQKSILFPELYPRIMLTKPPKVRNPFEVTGFDKHVYSALKYIYKENLAALSDMSINKAEVEVMSFEDKMKTIKK